MRRRSETPLILCVDDETSILSALRRVFLDEPWELLFATSGPEGLEMMQKHHVDVALSDYRMPGMNGVEFLKESKEIQPDCMRVVLSGYADISAILSALNEGEVYRFVNKPWNDAELLESIRKALEHSRLREENNRLNLELAQKVAQRTREVELKERALHIARTLLEVSSTPVVGLDDAKSVVFANKRARQRIGVGETLPPEHGADARTALFFRESAGSNGLASLVVGDTTVGVVVLADDDVIRELSAHAPEELSCTDHMEGNMSQLSLPSVLIVDDERRVLSALGRCLDDEPYDVHTCDDPELALERVEQERPSVVLADYYMPKMNGPEFLQKVRAIDDTIVRIILTGKPDVTAVLESVKVGSVYRFLLKPWDEDELTMSLRQAVSYHNLMVGHNQLLERLGELRGLLANYGADAPEVAAMHLTALANETAS